MTGEDIQIDRGRCSVWREGRVYIFMQPPTHPASVTAHAPYKP